MDESTKTLLPIDKRDVKAIERLIKLGYPAVEAILPELLEWMQDINWPVAQKLWPFLASIGAPLAPYIRPILKTDDDLWKYWIVICVVAESRALTLELIPELEQLAVSPTDGERMDPIDILAQNILRRLRNGTNESVQPEQYRT